MNFKSQLEWFYTLPNVVITASGFPKIKWQIANRPKANVIRFERLQQNDAAVARILYAELQQAEAGQAIVDNWTAYLSRHSVKAAYKVKSMVLARSRSSDELAIVFEEILSIGFTFAAEPIVFLANFNCDRPSEDIWYRVLHGYCHKKMQGRLIDRLRTKEGNKTFMRTNLGLVARASETQLTESLALSGIQATETEKYLFVRRCFIEVKNAYQIDTKSPTAKDFQLISERVRELEDKHQYNLFATTVAEDEIKIYLEQIGKAIRYLIDRPISSLDRSVSSEDSTPLLEQIADDTTKNDLDFVEQNSLTDELTAHTYNYLQRIDGAKWLIWYLKELVALKQTDIAILIGSTQKTVSLNYRKAWQNFLTATISEFQSEDSLQSTSETIIDLKEGLVEIVQNCFRSSLQKYLRSLPSKDDRFASQQLVEFLQNRSNKKLIVNPDIQQKLDNFIKTINRLPDV